MFFKKATKKAAKDLSDNLKEEFKDEIDTFKIVAGVSIALNVILALQNHKLRINPVQTVAAPPVTVIFAPPTR